MRVAPIEDVVAPNDDHITPNEECKMCECSCCTINKKSNRLYCIKINRYVNAQHQGGHERQRNLQSQRVFMQSRLQLLHSKSPAQQ